MTRPLSGHSDGFTLLEVIAVIIIISVAAVPISALFGKASVSLLNEQRIQTATQLAQERAEQVFGRRRKLGFATIVPAAFPPEALSGNYVGYFRTTTITRPVAPAGCPATALCDRVVVSVNAGTAALAEITFVLVKY